MAEYVCADGRMSVNGICPVVNQNDGSNNIIPTKTFDEKYESIEDIPITNIKQNIPITNIRQNIPITNIRQNIPITNIRQDSPITGTSIDTIKTDFSKDVKSTFEWDFDKVGNKVQNFGSTIKGNINAYDDYIEEKFGISKTVSNVFRTASVVKGAATYGALGAVAPFLIPFIGGDALNSQKRKEEYEKASKINKAETAAIQSRVDTQYQNQMRNDGRDFSVSGPDTSANPTGKSNQASSERGYSLHG